MNALELISQIYNLSTGSLINSVKNTKLKKPLLKFFNTKKIHNKKSGWTDINKHYTPTQNNHSRNIPNHKIKAETKHIIIDSLLNSPQIESDANTKAIVVNPPYGPNQIRQAYGVVQVVPTNGVVKVGIIGCFNAPNIQSDFDAWTDYFGLPRKTLIITPNGSVPSPTGSNLGWNLELQLDIQSVYTICQNCEINIFLSPSASFADIKSTIALANSRQMNVISMSFGSRELTSAFLRSSSSLESVLTSTTCCYLASTGDSSFPSYPALNPNVLAIGGSTLNLVSNNGIASRANEITWQSAGAGYSKIYSKPTYQNGIPIINKNKRAIPDVSAVANPNTGVYVYCSSYDPKYNWYQVGGTSLSCPLNAGLIANGLIYRYNSSKNPLTTVANLQNDVHNNLYKLYKRNTNTFYSSYFYDITKGKDNGFTAGAKFDIPTGLGVANFDAVAKFLNTF